MTDLQLLGLGLIGFAVAVVAGVLLGSVGARLNRRRDSG
jgi:Na+-transporting methylmalonyl-CoA/oxaloacetate decarboxylase beta subunit